MVIGKVVGNLVSTIKHPVYHGKKIMLVQPLGPGGIPQGHTMVAVDTIGAGIGETVLVSTEGKAAREILGDSTGPVRSLIVGIIDTIQSIDGFPLARE